MCGPKATTRSVAPGDINNFAQRSLTFATPLKRLFRVWADNLATPLRRLIHVWSDTLATPLRRHCKDMDAENERRIFNLLVEITGRQTTAQYFLVISEVRTLFDFVCRESFLFQRTKKFTYIIFIVVNLKYANAVGITVTVQLPCTQYRL